MIKSQSALRNTEAYSDGSLECFDNHFVVVVTRKGYRPHTLTDPAVSPRRNKVSQLNSLREKEVSKRGRAFGFGSRPGAVSLSMRQRQHSKKLGPADWPIGVFPSHPVSSAVVRKSCCGGSPTMAPKSLIICAWSAKPQA